jgi:hypothetical protein
VVDTTYQEYGKVKVKNWSMGGNYQKTFIPVCFTGVAEWENRANSSSLHGSTPLTMKWVKVLI